MSETTRRPGDILGEMICVAQVDEFEAILGIMPEHEAAVLAVQHWVNDIQAFDLQETFGTEEGFWEVMERLGYDADKEDYDDIDNMDVELWTNTARQAERIARLNAFVAELHAKALSLTAPEHRAHAATLKVPGPLLEFLSQHQKS
jgi:plasmid maintenance system antidote protein VapI